VPESVPLRLERPALTGRKFTESMSTLKEIVEALLLFWAFGLSVVQPPELSIFLDRQATNDVEKKPIGRSVIGAVLVGLVAHGLHGVRDRGTACCDQPGLTSRRTRPVFRNRSIGSR
jgi:hypothetical protein